MKKVIVTGGAGFIGSHLCELLIESKNYEVTSIDNYTTGNKKNHINGVRYIDGDTNQIDQLIDFTPDLIFHLGEYSRVEQSFDDIDKVFQSNQSGTYAVLRFWKKHKCKLVYAGSSTKFGDGGLGASQSPYGWTKSTNTELVKRFSEWFGLSFAIVYFYNAFGPREISQGKYATLIALFKSKMNKGNKLSVVLPGTQERNFTHVKDIVDGIMLVAQKGSGDGYGIGNDKSYSINEIAKLFNGEVVYLPERAGNRKTADLITAKTKDLGWKTRYQLEEYIYQLKENNWED